MMSDLSLLAEPVVVITITSGAANNVKLGIMTIIDFPCISTMLLLIR